MVMSREEGEGEELGGEEGGESRCQLSNHWVMRVRL